MAKRSLKAAATPASGTPAERVKVYFASQPDAAHRRLRQLRALITAVAPDAVEWFSYGIPGFRLDDRPFVWYAAFTRHVSLYPMTARIRAAFARELEGFETSKGTVRFSLERPLPATLVKRLVKARMAEVRKGR